jgi:hypothetical protein
MSTMILLNMHNYFYRHIQLKYYLQNITAEFKMSLRNKEMLKAVFSYFIKYPTKNSFNFIKPKTNFLNEIQIK